DDRIAITHERERTADRGLRRDVADDVSVRRAAEAAVGDERDLLREPGADDRAGHRQHLAHAGTAARALVADDDAITLADRAAQHGVERVLLLVEDASGEAPHPHRVTGDLHHAALGRERAAQDHHPAARRERFRERPHDLLT